MTETAISKIRPEDSTLYDTRYGPWKYVIPLPPESLRRSVGGSTVENFLVVADAWGQVISRWLAPGSTVLDVGCGCGRLARVLINHAYVRRYIGFDVVGANIEWSRNFIQPEGGRQFSFHHCDLYSHEYNPTGALRASEFRFPATDRSVTVAVAASVFTHLLELDANHYLREIARVLERGGKAILSIHVDVPAGSRFSGTEARIDIHPDYFVRMSEAAGLRLIERLGEVGGQEVFVFTGATGSETARSKDI